MKFFFIFGKFYVLSFGTIAEKQKVLLIMISCASNRNKAKYFQFEIFSKYSDIQHFISTKDLGDMSLYMPFDKQQVIENRQQLAQIANLEIHKFVFQQQVHGTKCSYIGKTDTGKGLYSYESAIADNDAMISNEKGICLIAMAGDCVPLLFYEPVQKVIAVAHAGWRGTYKKIARKTIEKMISDYHCKAGDIMVGMGPSISQKHYEVDDPVYQKFKEHIPDYSNFFSFGKEKGKYYLDLWAANKQQLLDAGLKEENIEISAICTYEQNDLFFSARRGDKERFVAGIIMK